MSSARRVFASSLALAALAIAAFGAGPAAAAPGEPTLPAGFQSERVYAESLAPTNFKFAADGRVFVAQKNGEIKVYPAGTHFHPETFADLRKPVFNESDRGLLGLALDPKFDEGRPYVYALYTFDHVLGEDENGLPKYPKWGEGPTYENDQCPPERGKCIVSGRLVRLKVALGTNHAYPSAAAPEETVLVEGWCQQYTSHSIGDLAFGPEGALYVSGGDGASYDNSDWGQFGNECGDPPGHAGENLTPPTAEGGSLRSQSPLRPNEEVLLNGTLLRINPDTGEAWPGNPFGASPNANKRRIIAFGFRNPFRFFLDPQSSSAYVDNVGNTEIEEIDRVPLGSTEAFNSGWPCYEGLGVNPSFQNAGLTACKRLYENPGSTEKPFFLYSHKAPVVPGDTCPTVSGSAISGVAMYEGSSYPGEYHRALFFSDSVRECIFVMKADEDGEPDPSRVEPFLSESGAFLYPGVDIEQGPGGDIYYSELGLNAVYRIFYDPTAPQARLSVKQAWGPAGFEFEFDASKSTGPAGDPLTYEWDFENDGTFELKNATSTQKHSYGAATTNQTATVKVTDTNNGKSSIARVTVYPEDSPPAVTITEPAPSTTWSVGETLKFAATAKEKGGTGPELGREAFYWNTRLLHCPFEAGACHEHPLQVFPAVRSGELIAPEHDYPSFVNFVLTVTDSRGLSVEKEVKVKARPVTLHLASSPPGIDFSVGQATEATPFDLEVIEDSPTTISAPETAEVGGVAYEFKRWTDNGPRARTVPAAASESFMAEYVKVGGEGPGGEPPVQLPPGNGDGGSQNPKPAPGPTGPSAPKISAHPAKQAKSGVARFAFGGDPGARFQCRLDNKKWAACASPRTYRGLKPGQHTFRVREVDAGAAPLTAATVFSWKVADKASSSRR